jgi:hypothetical protein
MDPAGFSHSAVVAELANPPQPFVWGSWNYFFFAAFFLAGFLAAFFFEAFFVAIWKPPEE